MIDKLITSNDVRSVLRFEAGEGTVVLEVEGEPIAMMTVAASEDLQIQLESTNNQSRFQSQARDTKPMERTPAQI